MKSENRSLKLPFLLLDLSLLYIAIFFINAANPIVKNNQYIYLLIATIAEIIAYTFYSRRSVYFQDNFKNRVKHISYRMMIFLFILFVLTKYLLPQSYSFQFILQHVTVFYILKLVFSYVLNQYLNYKRKNGAFLRNIAVLGLKEEDFIFGYLIEKNPKMGLNLIGYIADNDDYDKKDRKIIGEICQLENLVKEHQIQRIFVTPSRHFEVDNARNLLSRCNKVGLKASYVMMNTYWNERGANDAGYISSMAIYNPQEIPLDSVLNVFVKRMFDIIFSSFVILFIFSWLFPIIALLIKLESKGPVFFLQKLTGINKKVFNSVKFRTMQVDKDADKNKITATKGRMTQMGARLKKYNMDKLPQIFNVLFGEMSIVGPSLQILEHYDQYSTLIDHYKVRQYVKPGITGWAQVNRYKGMNNKPWDMKENVDFDMEYLKNWSFLWDLKIIHITLFGIN